MSNTPKGQTTPKTREQKFYIKETSAPLDYTITVTKGLTPNTVLMPNQVSWGISGRVGDKGVGDVEDRRGGNRSIVGCRG
jgi:hypothetical protein